MAALVKNFGAAAFNMLRRLTIGGSALLAVGFALVVALQRKLVYVPSLPGAPRDVYPLLPGDPRLSLWWEEVWLTTADGERLHAWLLANKALGLRKGPTVLFFQENAGNIAHRLPNAHRLIEQLACNVLLVSYRGFGRSSGSPSERGLVQDAQAALDYVRGRSELDPGRVVLFGRSLGGAVAAALAAGPGEGKVKAVVLENTFSSIPAMAGQLMPLLGALVGPGKPLNFFVRDKWETLGRVAHIGAPVLFVSSGRDEMVPQSQMRALLAARQAVAGRTSVWLELPRATHMDAWQVGGTEYWNGLRQFMSRHGGLTDE